MAPVFIALDVSSADQARTLLAPFTAAGLKPAVKVGMELFYASGPAFVRELKAAGLTVFLDLKLYDIPNTVAQTVAVIADLKVDYLTLHAAGGPTMMAVAQANAGQNLKLLGVTQLTSFSEAEVQAIQQNQVSLQDSVCHLAKLAAQAGLAGVICSAWEAKAISVVTSADFLKITPGIRLAGQNSQDQARVATPSQARYLGASGIVVGRTITQAVDPISAYQTVVNEWRHNDNH